MEIDDDRPTYTIFFSVIHILLCKNISRSPSRGMEEKSLQQIDYFILKCHRMYVYMLYSHLIHMHDRMKVKYLMHKSFRSTDLDFQHSCTLTSVVVVLRFE